MHSAASRSISFVVIPGLMCGVRKSSTSEASLPATRIPWISSAFLYVIGMGRIIPEAQWPRRGQSTIRPVTPHITEFEGGNALSAFRVQQILPRLQAIHPQVNALSARFVHLVATDRPLADSE